jgi:hypothetical protein
MGDKVEYHSLLWNKFVDEKRLAKVARFGDLFAEGKEFDYNHIQDRLYSDLNNTLTDRHLEMATLRHLDEEIAERAEIIMRNDNLPKRRRVIDVIALVHGRKVSELKVATRKAIEEVGVAKYIEGDLRTLKPTELFIFTNIPDLTADPFVQSKINPLYNSPGSGKNIPIRLIATKLEEQKGILTGRITYIPDEIERFKIMASEYAAFLEKHIDLIR